MKQRKAPATSNKKAPTRKRKEKLPPDSSNVQANLQPPPSEPPPTNRFGLRRKMPKSTVGSGFVVAIDPTEPVLQIMPLAVQQGPTDEGGPVNTLLGNDVTPSFAPFNTNMFVTSSAEPLRLEGPRELPRGSSYPPSATMEMPAEAEVVDITGGGPPEPQPVRSLSSGQGVDDEEAISASAASPFPSQDMSKCAEHMGETERPLNTSQDCANMSTEIVDAAMTLVSRDGGCQGEDVATTGMPQQETHTGDAAPSSSPVCDNQDANVLVKSQEGSVELPPPVFPMSGLDEGGVPAQSPPITVEIPPLVSPMPGIEQDHVPVQNADCNMGLQDVAAVPAIETATVADQDEECSELRDVGEFSDHSEAEAAEVKKRGQERPKADVRGSTGTTSGTRKRLRSASNVKLSAPVELSHPTGHTSKRKKQSRPATSGDDNLNPEEDVSAVRTRSTRAGRRPAEEMRSPLAGGKAKAPKRATRSTRAQHVEPECPSDQDVHGDSNPLTDRGEAAMAPSGREPDSDVDEPDSDKGEPVLGVDDKERRKREYERKRKAAYRKRTRESKHGVQGPEGVVRKRALQLFEGIPLGSDHTDLVSELSVILRRLILCTTPLHDIPDSTMQSVYVKLHSKYTNGADLCYKWCRRRISALLIYRRTRTRRIVGEYLGKLAAEPDVDPPSGVFPAEIEFFKKELTDDVFDEKRARFTAMSASMVENRGCGNAMGRGGVGRFAAFHILAEKTTPSIEEVARWKEERYAAYAEGRPDEAATSAAGPPNDGNKEGSERISENAGAGESDGGNSRGASESGGVGVSVAALPLHPDWYHPYLGVKCFCDEYKEMNGKDPSNEEIASWCAKGRPALT